MITTYHPEEMLHTFCLLTCLATLAMLLEPQWSWTNSLFGAVATHVLIGHLYASKAISACCLQQPQTPRDSYRSHCMYACAILMIVELPGAVFFGVFGNRL